MKRMLLSATAVAALACVSVLAVVGPAAAQDAAAPDLTGAAETYTSEFFERFAPRTALDMLRQVPGFTIKEESEARGLGDASGNVLINGKRASGKSDDVLAELGRIPARNVVRIEIVDGATLGVPGLYGQVANIITKSTGINGQYSWRTEFRPHNTRPVFGRFNASASGEEGPVAFTLALENQASHGGADGLTTITNADGTLRELRDDVVVNEFDQPKGSVKLAIDGPGSSVANLNANYRQFWFDRSEIGLRTGPGLIDRTRTALRRENGSSFEVGGDVEFKLGPGRLKLIGLYNGFQSEPETYVITEFVDGSPMRGDRIATSPKRREAIARGEYRWKTGKSDWQVSTEAAFNSLDNVTQRFVLQPNGVFTEIPLPGGTARVEEDRYEAVATWSRPITKRLNLQIAAGGERSTLTQTGGGGLERTFWRPKGSATATWKFSDHTTLTTRLKRSVGQLNFFDFLASVDIQNGGANAGNVNLRPPQSWELESEVSQKIGAIGTTTIRAYAQRISDIVDVVPIGPTEESIGNLDSATVMGIDTKSTILLDSIGWKGAKIDLKAQFQTSSVDDPLDGEPREISNSLLRNIEFDLRYDVPDTNWAFGGGLYHEKYSPEIRLTEEGFYREGPLWGLVFAEYKDLMGLTLRAQAGNLPGARERWDRIIYVDRRDGPIDFYENRNRRIGRIFAFTVSGKF